MKKNYGFVWGYKIPKPLKLLRIMKLTIGLMLGTVITVLAGSSYAQTKTLDIAMENSTVKEVLSRIEDQSEFYFMYSEKFVDVNRKVSLNIKDEKINNALSSLFEGTDVEYSINDRIIVLTNSDNANNAINMVLQQKSVSGTVTDSDGVPLPGVTVLVKGTTNGTVTNADGVFILANVKPENTLVFSFVGMLTQEVEIGNKTLINITMQARTIGLEEVVAIGYGTQKKENLTGSVSTVIIEDLEKRQVSNTTAALQGKVAGLKITQGTGMPGRESVSVQLRGASSWGTNTTPLVLVDGVVGSLDGLPSTDIESISVLKDAASASIYGARAANGVILVTTKKGKSGKPTLSYNMSVGSQSPTGVPNQIWNSVQYMELFNKAVARNAVSAVPFPQTIVDKYKNPGRDMELYPDFNWADAVWKSALIQEHNVGVNGGTENVKYNISAGFLDQDGVLIGHGYKRYNGLANLSTDINKYISIGTNITYLYGESESPYYENQNFVLMSMTQAPMYKPYLPDGSGRYTDKTIPTGVGGAQNNRNPFWIANESYRNYQDWKANIQGWVDVNFIQGKDMQLKWSTKYATNFSEQFQNIYHYGADAFYYLPEKEYVTGGSDEHMKGTPFGPEAQAVFNNNYRTTLSTLYSTLTWNWELNDHDISVMGGYSQESQYYRWLGGNRSVFPVKNMYEIDGMGTTNQVVSGGHTEWAFQSYFGRATYAFRSKYLLEANFRYDGTSRIYKDSRWGFFPSGSAAWRLTEESFMKDNIEWLSNLKIRASYGLLGNANIGDYPWQDTYSTTSYAFNGNLDQGVLQTSFKNKKLEWEKTKITNIGIEFNLKEDIFYGTVEWYNKYTSGILAGASIPRSAGMSAPTVNYGEFKNYGIELELGHRNTIGELKYNVYAQISRNRNEVMKYPAPVYGNRVIEEGEPYNDYYLYEYIGIFKSQAELDAVKTPGNPQLGDIMFKDQNNDKVIDGKDRVRVKGAYPNLMYSFGANVIWKNFDISMFFQGVDGQKVRTYFFGEDPFSQSSSPHPKFLDAYDPVTNPDSNIPSIYGWGYAPMTGGTAQNSTYFLKDASYLRLKNLQIGYLIPSSLSQKIGIRYLKVFATGDNLLTFTSYPDLDPERAGDGWHAQYPQLKTLSFGLNVKF
jgi:TonB-linked SusC/RagA family outer membrane protein